MEKLKSRREAKCDELYPPLHHGKPKASDFKRKLQGPSDRSLRLNRGSSTCSSHSEKKHVAASSRPPDNDVLLSLESQRTRNVDAHGGPGRGNVAQGTPRFVPVVACGDRLRERGPHHRLRNPTLVRVMVFPVACSGM